MDEKCASKHAPAGEASVNVPETTGEMRRGGGGRDGGRKNGGKGERKEEEEVNAPMCELSSQSDDEEEIKD